jgi:hypothetical protein
MPLVGWRGWSTGRTAAELSASDGRRSGAAVLVGNPGAEQVGEGEIFEALQRRGAEVGAELADDRSRLPAGGYPFESGSAR